MSIKLPPVSIPNIQKIGVKKGNIFEERRSTFFIDCNIKG